MVNYLSRFISNLSTNFVHLRRLLSEKEPWHWTFREDEEFLRVKNMVSDICTLRYYDIIHPLIIECDARCYGLETAVFQNNGVVGFASRTLTSTEKNYAQIEKKPLAIFFACLRLD